ncbi:mechanosensitive ion channel family protein [Microvirga sp. HBU67558]|uniref:mechanosensitive ion channel family protein n=1 Tax=Microvirga TaxID=186650 RepID=UPI001B39C699|nr:MULTISPECIES: mechanosensitive ion channel family protein [unclassified Microvirga]MBQ0821681.1 mechanosensitive ion channel family protein [Microvirga sp. HBU67558]
MRGCSCIRVLIAMVYGAVLLFLGSLGAEAQPQPAPNPPPQVQQMLQLLQDPAVQTWINEQKRPPVAAEAPAAEPTVSEIMMQRITGLRGRLAALAAAVPRLPDEFRTASGRLLEELQGRRPLSVLVLILGFLALGAGAERLFRAATGPSRRRIVSRPATTTTERLHAIVLRFAFNLADLAIFAAGSIGAFLALDWPPLLRQVVVAYLVAAVVLRLALIASRFLLAPNHAGPEHAEQFRLIPLDAVTARFWHRRVALFVGWFAFGWASVDALRILGFTPDARAVMAYALGLGLLVIAINVVWTRPRPAFSSAPEAGAPRRLPRALAASLLSLYFVLVWGLWVAGLMGFFWLAVIALLLPLAISLTEKASRHALRPHEGVEAATQTGLMAVYLDRGIRALLIAGAVLLLADAWHIDLVEMTSRDTLLTRLVRGALSAVVILLVADLVWQVTKTLIDKRLARAQAQPSADNEIASREARLRTLLPIFRNVIFAVLAVVAILMVLSALGVEIGPLIAGAGIAGVAVGFGAQTLVKDVISGVFYLLDDAFRVGEYIQSGSYKGTVESFSLRSVKLRHHRGPVYTVPFGVLGAVENMSRDWVIDKFQINVPYDTDLEKARKLIKKIGQDMAADPEYAPNIIEPLKMQGVEQFGDFAIQIRCKMTTRPGEQFVIRRKAFARIKQAFDENGIKFAFPTVQVAGGETAPAVAQEGLQLVKPAGAAE